MSGVFAHGRLRLYLLKLLDESPRHGYEVIRLLEERFHGLYAPSAGTVYPRLAKLEQEGLVEHSTEGGRKVYRITEAGREELTERQEDLAELEVEISDSVAQLAGAIREDVRDSAKDLRAELRDAARNAPRAADPGTPRTAPLGGEAGWQRTKEEFAGFKAQAKKAKEQERAAKEQAKKAKEEARKAKEQSQAVRQAAQQEALRIKRRVEQQVREHVSKGDWPTGLAEGLSELTRGLAGLADSARWGEGAGSGPSDRAADKVDFGKGDVGGDAPADLPDWARTEADADPARELERLLDRFRDQVRDASRDATRDGGRVTADQLAEAQSVLAGAAERLRRLLG
ncbi:helix-turn-helix transcriptional regulator [Kitasatospora sp. NBC_01287]|uniref:PadR family transcriptional regulator n=1 Tax=Kitasatospora sp. NBC_01287 TaxID=2903573 RepID=UPI002256EC9C|nr:PadR family transcriptional regulator [Kitasatospora sp. NBC_01287]MCX4746789.1 helix-turn-helix transcriptional regulator [Kitasatospora sp. NBC_01287]